MQSMQPKQRSIALQQAIPPFFRREESVKDIVLPQLIACAVLLIPAIIHYGFRAVVMALFGIIGAVVTEGAWKFFGNKPQSLSDLTAVATGLMCALLIPAQCPVWAPLFASAFAVGAAKLPFGGPGRAVFSPPAIGSAFALLCWGTFRSDYAGNTNSLLYVLTPRYCFGYASGKLPVLANIDTSTAPIRQSVSPLNLLVAGDRNMVSPSDVVSAVCDPALTAGDFLLGTFNGPMGTTICWLIVLCAVGLTLFGCCAWQSSVGFVAAVGVISLLFPYDSIPVWQSPLYDLFTGATLFSAVFLAGDIMTAPHMNSGRLVYGICCGIMTMILRRIGMVECGAVFAAALVSPFVSTIDHIVWKFRQRGISFHTQRKKFERKIRRILRINPSPFDSFDFDDEEDGNGTEI